MTFGQFFMFNDFSMIIFSFQFFHSLWESVGYSGQPRQTSDPSGTAQNEQNNKPWTATPPPPPLVQGDQISDIIWWGGGGGGSIICVGVFDLIHAWTTHKYVVKISSQGPEN